MTFHLAAEASETAAAAAVATAFHNTVVVGADVAGIVAVDN